MLRIVPLRDGREGGMLRIVHPEVRREGGMLRIVPPWVCGRGRHAAHSTTLGM